MNEEAQEQIIPPSPPLAGSTPDTANRLYGVHGWLKFLVVMNLYIGPILFALQIIFAGIRFSIISNDHPEVVLYGLIEIGISGYLVARGIRVARGLRDIKPRAVQNAKVLLKLCFAWGFASIPLNFISGVPTEQLIPEIIRGAILNIVTFAIWYSYLNISKRVKNTYPDWKDCENKPTMSPT